MAGRIRTELSGAELRAFQRIERDLAMLKSASYFTEEQWVQIDYIIHRGKYKFTNGPKPLIDLFEPLDDQLVNIKTIQDADLAEDIILLNPIQHKYSSFLRKLDDFDDSNDTVITAMMAKRTAQSLEETTAEAEAARIVKVKEVCEDSEMNKAAEWERDDDEPSATPLPSTKISESQNSGKARDTQTPAPPRTSAKAVKAIAAIRLEIDAHVDSKVESNLQQLQEVQRASTRTQKLYPRVCYFWTIGKCKYGESCKILHSYPGASPSKQQSPKYQNGQKSNQVNKSLSALTDRKSGLISTAKELTCFWWAKHKGDCPECPDESLCKHSHWGTGKLAPAPFWEQNQDGRESITEKDEVAGEESKSSRPGDDHTGMDVELGEVGESDHGNKNGAVTAANESIALGR